MENQFAIFYTDMDGQKTHHFSPDEATMQARVRELTDIGCKDIRVYTQIQTPTML